MYIIIVRLVLLFFLVLGAHSALAQTEPYLINPGDVLGVFLWNEEALSGEFIDRPDGVISFPMVGQIPVGGRTPSDVEKSVAAGLSKFLRDKPGITVSLLRMDGNIIYVLGKVNNPGAFSVATRVDVTQALALAGGLSTFATV